MSLRSLKFAVLAAPFLLTACGERFEQIRTSDIFPYGNQRTAGTQVAYVLAKMMPKKELKLKTVTRAQAATPIPEIPETPAVPDVPVQEKVMEKLFDDALKK